MKPLMLHRPINKCGLFIDREGALLQEKCKLLQPIAKKLIKLWQNVIHDITKKLDIQIIYHIYI